MAKIKKTNDNTYCEDVKDHPLVLLECELVISVATMKTSVEVPQRARNGCTL